MDVKLKAGDGYSGISRNIVKLYKSILACGLLRRLGCVMDAELKSLIFPRGVCFLTKLRPTPVPFTPTAVHAALANC